MKKKLKEKGWAEKEIKKVEEVLAKERRSENHLSKIVFWSAIIITILGNLMVSVVLIPFLLVLNNWILYSIVVLLAGTLGFLYKFLIRNVAHVKKRHRLSASIIIPLIALANVITMVTVSNNMIIEMKIENIHHNPLIVAIIFAAVFILPYVFSRILRKD